MKIILLLPGWMTGIRFYDSLGDLEARIGKLNKEDLFADYIIGLSLGSLVVLKNSELITGKIILINPPLPKRNPITWFFKWLNYIFSEGLFLERQKFMINPVRFIKELVNCIKLLSIDFSKTLDNIPKKKLTVLRSKNDKFFCDSKAVDLLRSKNINILEINASHNWCEEIEKAISQLTI